MHKHRSRGLVGRIVGFEPLEGRTLLSGSAPTDLVAVGNRLFFLANDNVHGQELWVSDGTAAGTRPVRDINPGVAGANIYGLTKFGNNKVAFAADDGSHGRELWISDGTAAGTKMVLDILNGSAEGFPTAIAAIGNTLYFSAGTQQFGRELWKSDGTAAGTVMVKDIYQGSIGSGSFGFTEAGGTIYFTADSKITTGQGSHQTTTYFGRELWKTDGTAAGTVMVKDINPDFPDSSPSELVNINGTLFFSAYTELGWELWRSNGTAASTVLVKDINPSFRSSDPRGLREYNGLLYFNAIDENIDQNLWRSDGTAAGTVIASDFAPGFTGFIIPSEFMDIGQSVVFMTVGQNLGVELWRTDHTAAGTSLLKELIPPQTFQSNPYRVPSLGQSGPRAFFTAIDPQVEMELHVTDGTIAGTMLLRDIFPGNGPFDPFPGTLTDVNGRLFFVADDGTHGRELWTSDGTPAGTRMVKDIIPSPGGPSRSAEVRSPLPTSLDSSSEPQSTASSLLEDLDGQPQLLS